MRGIVLSLLLPAAAIWALTSGYRAVLALCWIVFSRPYSFDYGVIKTMPWFQIFFLIALFSNIIRGRFRLIWTPFLIVFLLFWAQLTLSCYLAYETAIAWHYYVRFWIPIAPVSLLIFCVIPSLREMKGVLWMMGGSMGLVGAKTGFITTLSGGGHIVDKINGFIGDNNGIAISLLFPIAILMGLRGTLPKSWHKFALIFTVIFSGLTIMFTKSRGGLLSMCLLFFIASTVSKHFIRNTVILIVVAALALLVIPSEKFSRMKTLENLREDASAWNRLIFWGYSWEIALEHPLTGIGMRNFMTYNNDRGKYETDKAFVEHSIYFQVLSATGFPGLLLFLTLVLITLYNLQMTYWRSKTLVNQYRELEWLASVSFWMRNGFIAYCFGMGFLNVLTLDYMWYFMWFSALLPPLLKRELPLLETESTDSEK